VPIVEVAARFGVTRQSVHRWLRRYAAQGLAGLGRLGVDEHPVEIEGDGVDHDVSGRRQLR
jgi:transposase-like protein